MLGIIDWGIGGIGIYKHLKEKRPGVSAVYFSDTGATPYGKMHRDELASRLDLVVDFLSEKNVTHLIIGCNAASTAIPDLADHGMKIEGVIEAAVDAAAKANPGSLGLIGGRRTVVSGVYRRAFAEKKVNVRQRVAQPLSGLIESGDVDSAKLRSEAERILAPLRGCSHILLACTHYPAIQSVLEEFVSREARFIDPARALVARTAKWKLESGERDAFYTTGNAEQMKLSARLAFGVHIRKVRKVTL
jgi:glutamate racemase